MITGVESQFADAHTLKAKCSNLTQIAKTYLYPLREHSYVLIDLF